MIGMTGIYQHSLDAKGRIFIPAKLREELGNKFVVTISMDECLSAYNQESWDRVMAKIRAKTRAEQNKMRPLFSHAAECELDSQGRILLPQRLRDYAKLTKNVAVVGNGECVEFWDADKWAEIDMAETTPENIEKVFMELDF